MEPKGKHCKKTQCSWKPENCKRNAGS